MSERVKQCTKDNEDSVALSHIDSSSTSGSAFTNASEKYGENPSLSPTMSETLDPVPPSKGRRKLHRLLSRRRNQTNSDDEDFSGREDYYESLEQFSELQGRENRFKELQQGGGSGGLGKRHNFRFPRRANTMLPDNSSHSLLESGQSMVQPMAINMDRSFNGLYSHSEIMLSRSVPSRAVLGSGAMSSSDLPSSLGSSQLGSESLTINAGHHPFGGHVSSFFQRARSRTTTLNEQDRPDIPSLLLSPASSGKEPIWRYFEDDVYEGVQVEGSTQTSWQLSAKYSAKTIIKSKVVGKGSTAVVKIVQENGTKRLFAAKIYHKYNTALGSGTASEYYSRLACEFKLARQLVHRNIVQTYDLLVDSSDSWCCVMDYCEGGDLFSLISAFKAENKRMPKDERNCLFKQLLLGVNYMHSQGIVHRDIKLENLLLTGKGCLKITDFGVSTVVQDSFDRLAVDETPVLCSGVYGSEPYIAPEVFESKLKGCKYDARLIDVWSCGIVLVNLVLNGGIFNKAVSKDERYLRYTKEVIRYWKSADTIVDNENEEVEPETPLFYLDEMGEMGKQTLTRMLNPDPNKRPYIENILQTPFVRKIGLCITADNSDTTHSTNVLAIPGSNGLDSDIGSNCSTPGASNLDVSDISSVKKVKEQHVRKNHNHRPPLKPQKQIAMGQLKNPYA